MNAPEAPPFRAPWQAQAFALAEHLMAKGLVSPREWADALGQAIRRAQTDGDPDTGETYWRHWLAALETILHEKQLASFVAVEAREATMAATPEHRSDASSA